MRLTGAMGVCPGLEDVIISLPSFSMTWDGIVRYRLFVLYRVNVM